MHETNHPDVKGYIDGTENKHPIYHVKGWCFYNVNSGSVSPFRLTNGDVIISMVATARPDVANHYHNDNLLD